MDEATVVDGVEDKGKKRRRDDGDEENLELEVDESTEDFETVSSDECDENIFAALLKQKLLKDNCIRLLIQMCNQSRASLLALGPLIQNKLNDPYIRQFTPKSFVKEILTDITRQCLISEIESLSVCAAFLEQKVIDVTLLNHKAVTLLKSLELDHSNLEDPLHVSRRTPEQFPFEEVEPVPYDKTLLQMELLTSIIADQKTMKQELVEIKSCSNDCLEQMRQANSRVSPPTCSSTYDPTCFSSSSLLPRRESNSGSPASSLDSNFLVLAASLASASSVTGASSSLGSLI